MTIAMRGGSSESTHDNNMAPNTHQQPQQQQQQTSEEDGAPQDADADAQDEHQDAQQPDFLHAELARLDEMINRSRWVVPVLPKGELELLLEASIDLCKRGLDTRSEACQRFFRDGLTVSFTKILTDEAVSGWKFEIHRCIMKNCERLVELCVTKLNHDWFPLLDLLAMALNPANKFNSYNGTRQSETVPPGCQTPDEELFARPPDVRTPRGWLVDLVNKFGQLNGFQILLERFQNGPSLSVPVVAALIRPFGLCYELLTVRTIEKYLMPVVDVVPAFLDNLTDEELNKEAKNEAKNDALSAIIKALKCLVSRVPSHDDVAKGLEIFRLKMILRLLQISPFNGKMNALNEVNKLIASVSYYSHRHGGPEAEEEWLTSERMAEWIKENKVLQIVLRDNLHQPQYVEKLEKIIRFMIKEKALNLEDLDNIWAAQAGKHEAIVKNVHDLLAKLAWDFSPEQLDHLFDCFQASWTNASRKQREKLLELIRRLAEDDKDGVMAHKVLSLLWNLAHSDDVPTEIMDQALTAHVKILDYSCSQDRDAQKTHWLDKCVDELKNDKWVLPALKQIREICCLYSEAPANLNHAQRSPHMFYRHEIINRLQQQHSLVILVADNLTDYTRKARCLAKEVPDLDPHAIWPESRYSHVQQVQERLNFLRFLLKDGQLWLCSPQAKQIWQCLAEHAVFATDREACFKWFSKLMGEEPDLDPEINKDFFENNVLQLDPCLLTENGMKCFDRFFKAVNCKEGKLVSKRRTFLMDDVELIGLDYLWRVVLCSGEEIAAKAIELLKETYTNLGPHLQASQVEIHEDFIQSCTDRLKAAYDTITVLERDKDSVNRIRQETTRMIRVLKVLHEYISECDGDFGDERTILPMARAHRGKHVTLVVRFPSQGRQVEDLDIWTHTNDTLASVRRQILNRVKANSANMKVDLFVNGEPLEAADDQKLISRINLRDKTLITAKLSQAGANMPSSPDSSSDSSTGSPRRPNFEGTQEAENCLPGVLMARHVQYAQFLFQLSDLGSTLRAPQLRDGARALLHIMPADAETVRKLRSLYSDRAKLGDESPAPSLESVYFASSPSQVLYGLAVTYSLLMPALNPMSEEAFEFQYNFIKSGGVPCVLGTLANANFLPSADVSTKKCAYHFVLKICKLMLTTVGHATVHLAAEGSSSSSSSPPASDAAAVDGQAVHATILRQALLHIPNANSEYMLRNVASRLSQHLLDRATGHLPDMATVKSIVRIVWASSAGAMSAVHGSLEELRNAHDKPVDGEDIQLCKEALEALSLSLALYPQGLDTLIKDKNWQLFVIDMVLLCRNRSVRVAAAEQFFLIATKCSTGHQPLLFFVTLLFTVLSTAVRDHAKSSHDYFQLLCRLLNCAHSAGCNVHVADGLLANEIAWLKKIRDNVLETGDIQVEETLLEGHLGITKELVSFLGPERKREIGCGDADFIKELVEDFIFPASKAMLQFRKHGEMPAEQAIPVCYTPLTMTAAFDLLVSLCTGCVANLGFLANMLQDMYYSDRDAPLTEWEYLCPVGPRPHKGFVGLKNAGATCYMNSVLQQLYMIGNIRNGILNVDGAAVDQDEDFSGEEKPEAENNAEAGCCDADAAADECKQRASGSRDESRREYNLGVLKQIQAIFGHLACSRLQYYVPRGLWRHFKLGGEPVNLREQHDALEFFNSLVDSVDEALKALGHDQILSNVLGGSFADQKICKDCPHRYSREESFTTLNIDIRNHSNLLDSLEQYVKGDLLEGANAYHCEKCSKKVNTVKRMCIKKLPPILAIQLKRFDYDWERESAVKFNDYFEFPRELDMGPYTVSGLAKLEGEAIQEDDDYAADSARTDYKLTGIVVHSGQASGGHYYSYVLHRHNDGSYKWYKFDDGEVTECKMDDDEEMRNQCFGGEYMGEVFDHMLKRMSYRRQKRWWNAYILFYQRQDAEADLFCESLQELTLADNKFPVTKMPRPIDRSVRKQNIKFMHNRNQFSLEYFQFMRKLIGCNAPHVSPQEAANSDGEELAMISIQLASRFLFTVGFRTKKSLRGPANEWYDALCVHLRSSAAARRWFAQHALFAHPGRFCEYMLECPSSEVRSAFVKIVVFLAHFSMQDEARIALPASSAPPCLDPNASLSDHLLRAVLSLLKKEVSEHGRHLTQYFTLFLMYSSLGIPERAQLLKLDVPATFMLVALDEGPGPPIKYQYAELGKLYQVVSQLIRCCDVSSKTQSANPGRAPLNNVHGEVDCKEFIVEIQPQVAEILYNRTSYVKKIIEDSNVSEDTVKLLKFCSWENPHFSSMVLSELLWQIAYSYTYELRPYLDLLLHMLLLEDSWQNHRIHNALKGIPDDRDGLFDTIQRSKNHYQKRAYQCIKCMVTLFTNCAAATLMLHANGDMKRKWTWAVEWLHDELERRPYSTNAQFAYNNWSPPAQSNETSNGYFLERSHSARLTLTKACELFPDDEPEDQDMSEEGDSPQPEEGKGVHYAHNLSQQQQQQQQQQAPPPPPPPPAQVAATATQQTQPQPQPQQQQPAPTSTSTSTSQPRTPHGPPQNGFSKRPVRLDGTVGPNPAPAPDRDREEAGRGRQRQESDGGRDA